MKGNRKLSMNLSEVNDGQNKEFACSHHSASYRKNLLIVISDDTKQLSP